MDDKNKLQSRAATGRMRLQWTVYPIGLLIALMLALADTAAGNDYGPQPPAGYMQKISGWFTAVKERVSNKIATLKDSFNKTQAAPANQARQPMGEADSAQTRLSLKPVQGLSGATVQSQPALVLPKAGLAITAFPIPSMTIKPKKVIAAQAPALPQFAEAKKRERYNTPGDLAKPVELPKTLNVKSVALAQYSGKAVENIELLADDAFKMIRALFSYLWDRADEAAKPLHELGTDSRLALVRQKSLAFTGWILAEKNLDALASLAFWRALESTPASQASASFDNAIAESLSELAPRTPLAKQWGEVHHKAAEKLMAAQTLKGEAHAFISIVLAEQAFDKHSYGPARRFAQAVPAKTRWKEQARFLAATSAFANKELKDGQQVAGRELTELFRTVEGSEVFDATAVTLGRIHFALGNYKAAHQYLAQVSRETNLFIEAAVDNGWALLRAGDRNHAVGNMFTLHTPNFEGAYMPDSYFLKSLGYQEICQFGDAMTAVKAYKQRYNNAFKTLIDFNSGAKAQEMVYYDDLTNYLTKKDHKMHPLVIRELGRHPQFLRRQKIMNAMAREERQIATVLPLTASRVVAWAAAPAEKVRTGLKKEIAAFLKNRALAMEDELKFVTANMSLLEYEIYAGAGQNLALQGAKNFAVDENKAKPKAEFELDKEYWPYEDEIWEDELNNFRSKMVDACAKAKQAGNG